jgi:ribonucleotide monophosphatase NagD (HAD superfamily)
MINPVMVGDSLETDALFAKNINIPFIHFIYSSQNNEH